MQILQHVWDSAYDPSTNVVEQYVGALCRKFDKPFGRDDLLTVRGGGYQLRGEDEPGEPGAPSE